jgi:transcriptional regulator with XRE-family HTH domain
MSVQELADRIGVDEKTLTRWESGETMPKLGDIAPITRHLPVTLDWIVGLQLEPEAVLARVVDVIGYEVTTIATNVERLMEELTAARRAVSKWDGVTERRKQRTI